MSNKTNHPHQVETPLQRLTKEVNWYRHNLRGMHANVYTPSVVEQINQLTLQCNHPYFGVGLIQQIKDIQTQVELLEKQLVNAFNVIRNEHPVYRPLLKNYKQIEFTSIKDANLKWADKMMKRHEARATAIGPSEFQSL